MINEAEWLRSGLPVSRETLDRMSVYEALLHKWSGKINLVASSTLHEVPTRHFLDSAQLWTLKPSGVSEWLDLGSGAGFPGMIIAIIAAEIDPALRVSLVESDARKAAFLMTVARETGLEVNILAQRIESLPEQQAQVVSARALAPLPKLLELSARHLKPGGTALFLKGQGADEEIAEALAKRSFSVQKFPSRTDPRGVILRIGELGYA